MTTVSKRQRAHLYIYKNKVKKRNPLIYKNLDTLQKARQFALRSYSQTAGHLALRDFS